MATTDAELISQVRVQTGYTSGLVLDDAAFASVLAIAKRTIRTRKAIEVTWEEADWYANEYREEALFWFACLRSKVAAGELDAQSLQEGAIDKKELLAKDDDSVTEWFRNAEKALKSVEPGDDTDAGYGHGIRGIAREDRVYGADADDDGTGAVTGDDL